MLPLLRQCEDDGFRSLFIGNKSLVHPIYRYGDPALQRALGSLTVDCRCVAFPFVAECTIEFMSYRRDGMVG